MAHPLHKQLLKFQNVDAGLKGLIEISISFNILQVNLVLREYLMAIIFQGV